MKVHQIRIDFHVTSEIKRYVFVYLIEADHCYLIDSGVAGSQDMICKKLREIGKKISDIKGIFLTHAHPDHIGTAAWFREKTECKVYASAGEKRWIEDIDTQYRERPIPNFKKLAGQSVPVDQVISDGEKIELEEQLVIEAVSTPGHSADEMSYRIDTCMFIGDSIPVKGDIPIYVDKDNIVKTMEKLEAMSDILWFYPAWDRSYSYAELKEKAEDGKQLVMMLDEAVKKHAKILGNRNLKEMIPAVCAELAMPELRYNPLFERTVKCHLKL